MFFVSSSDALFLFYICSQSKVEKVKISELLLPLTNGICARDVIFHSLQPTFSAHLRDKILIIRGLPHSIR